jgi:hypothetical protein
MRLMYLPTLSEMREMLGEELYVKFIWMWREQEQDARAWERRQKLLAEVAIRPAAGTFPTPMFTRAAAVKGPSPAKGFQPAILRPNLSRVEDGMPVSEIDGLLEQIRADATARDLEEEPLEAVGAASGRRRLR